MGTRVASILAEIGIDSSKFTTGARGVNSGIMGMIGSFTKLAGGIGIAVTALTTLYDFLKKSEQAAVESAKVDAKLEAVLKSTGGAVGMTSQQLDRYATSISKAAGLDDELVKNSEAVMLTFTKIGGDKFQAAMQAATDMSAVMGTDLQGSVVQVGKAMNDFTGYTALRRAGVSFTAAQVEQIKGFKETNNLIAYQDLLLAELSKEFGGAATAMNNADDGSENLKIAWENLQEAVGAGMVSRVKQTNDQLTRFVDNTTSAVTEANKMNTIMKNLGITWVQGVGYIKDGVRITTTEAEALTDAALATQAYTDRLTEQARAYYLAHPELKKYVDEMGVLRDVTDKTADSLDDEASAANNATTGIGSLANNIGRLNNIDTSFGTKIKDALDKIKFQEAGGTGLQNLSDLVIGEVDSGQLGTELGQTWLTALAIGEQALAVRMGEESALEAKKTIVETLGLTWAEAETELQKWLKNPHQMTVNIQYQNAGFLNNSSNGIPTTPEGWEIYYNRDFDNDGIGRAGGGPIWSNKPYLVGERGPELIVPRQNGNVIPNNQLGGNVVNFYGDAYFSVEGEVTAQDIMKQMRVEA